MTARKPTLTRARDAMGQTVMADNNMRSLQAFIRALLEAYDDKCAEVEHYKEAARTRENEAAKGEREAALIARTREEDAQIATKHATRNFPWASENSHTYHAQAEWAKRIAAAIRALAKAGGGEHD